jgi:type I restriction enzyme R subunit
MIQALLERLHEDRPKLAPLRVWQAYAALDEIVPGSGAGNQPISELTALVGLIRRVCGIDQVLVPYSDTVRRNFQNWIMKHHSGAGEKFNEDQMAWLRMIRDHVAASFRLERDDLEMAPFDGFGGIGRMYQVFGEQMDGVIEELNEVLAA